jgi:hypothetical protein
MLPVWDCAVARIYFLIALCHVFFFVNQGVCGFFGANQLLIYCSLLAPGILGATQKRIVLLSVLKLICVRKVMLLNQRSDTFFVSAKRISVISS